MKEVSFQANLLPSATIENEIQVKRLYKAKEGYWLEAIDP